MTEWYELLREDLAKCKVTPSEFGEIVQRLLDRGVIWREETQVETQMYDAAMYVYEHLDEFFALMGFRLLRNEPHQYIKAYPPGANVPSLQDDDVENKSFRKRLTENEIVTSLALRYLYQKEMEQGAFANDESEVVVTLEQLGTLMDMKFKHPLPEALTERRSIFNELTRIKMIRYNPDALEEDETLLFIRPLIIDMVSLNAMNDAFMATSDVLPPEQNENDEG